MTIIAKYVFPFCVGFVAAHLDKHPHRHSHSLLAFGALVVGMIAGMAP